MIKYTNGRFSLKKICFFFFTFICICLLHLRHDIHSAGWKWYWIPFARFFQDIQWTSLCVAIPFLFALFVTTRYSFMCIDAFDAISPIYSRRRIFVSRRFELKEKILRKETKRLDGLRNITDDCKDYFDDIFCTYVYIIVFSLCFIFDNMDRNKKRIECLHFQILIFSSKIKKYLKW